MKLSYLFACLSVGTTLIGGGISTQAFAQNNNVQNNNAHANIASKVAPSVHTQEVSIPPLTKIDEKGYVYNSQGICNARIDKKGNIVDGHNRNLGRIYKNGTIYNAKNENVGSVGKKGIIYSPTKTMIGKIDKKGEVFNSNNVKVGQVAKNHKSAAVLLLLNANDVFSQY